MFQMAFVYELPYKTNARGNDVAHLILGDWQVNGIYSAISGTPFTITARRRRRLNMPGNPQTANLNGDYKVIGDHGDAGFYFDPTPFSQPQGVTFGNTGRNQFRGPGYWNIDFSIFRAFPFGGGKRVEFRAEFFNLFNHPMWGMPGVRHHQRQLRACHDGRQRRPWQRQRERLGHRRTADPLRRAVPVLNGLRTPGYGRAPARCEIAPAFSCTRPCICSIHASAR